MHKSNVQKFKNGEKNLFHKADAFPVPLSITCIFWLVVFVDSEVKKILKTCFNSDLEKLNFFTNVYNFS